MLEATALKAAIKKDGANLGLITSPFIHDAFTGFGAVRGGRCVSVARGRLALTSYPTWRTSMAPAVEATGVMIKKIKF
jgi:hypothetical protein